MCISNRVHGNIHRESSPKGMARSKAIAAAADHWARPGLALPCAGAFWTYVERLDTVVHLCLYNCRHGPFLVPSVRISTLATKAGRRWCAIIYKQLLDSQWDGIMSNNVACLDACLCLQAWSWSLCQQGRGRSWQLLSPFSPGRSASHRPSQPSQMM